MVAFRFVKMLTVVTANVCKKQRANEMVFWIVISWILELSGLTPLKNWK